MRHLKVVSSELMRQFLLSFFSQKRIAGGAFVLAFTQLLASVCGFLRDQAFSIMFPIDSDPLGVASVYIAAFRPSDLLFQIFVMSSLSVLLVPFLSAHLAHDRKEQVDHILTSTMIVFGAIFGSIALVLALFFPWVAPHLVKFTGESLELYIQFGRIALFTNFLFVFGNALGQYLIAIQRYWMYGLSPIIWSLCTIAGTYLLTPILGPLGPMIGTLIGTMIYIAIRGIGVVKNGYRLSVGTSSIVHPELRHMGLLIIPRMVALGAVHLQFLLFDRLASGLDTSMVALNQFARNFESVVPGIVGIAIAQSAFSLLSQSAAKKDTKLLHTQMRKAILFNVSLAVPGAIVLALTTSVAAWLMRLEASIIPTFTSALLIYAIAIPFESSNHIILRTFYALKNTGWPALSSAISSIIAVIVGTALIDSLGVYALAIAYVVSQVTQTAFLSFAFFRYTKPNTLAPA